jgi:hypothetical protein
MDTTLGLKYVSALLPMAMGVGVIFFERLYTKWKYSPRGVSPSYFASVALLFALFASLIFSEVWGKISKTNALMTQQANSLRALLRMTEPLGPDSIRVANAVKNYIQKLKEQEVNDDMLAQQGFSVYKQQSFNKKTYQEFYLIAADNKLFEGHPHMQAAFYSELESVREAWFERRELRKQHIPSTKIAVLFLFGFFTQLAIAFSHIGNNNATRATVMLFSLAFATSIALLAYIDNPHQTSYLVSTSVLDDIR